LSRTPSYARLGALFVVLKRDRKDGLYMLNQEGSPVAPFTPEFDGLSQGNGADAAEMHSPSVSPIPLFKGTPGTSVPLSDKAGPSAEPTQEEKEKELAQSFWHNANAFSGSIRAVFYILGLFTPYYGLMATDNVLAANALLAVLILVPVFWKYILSPLIDTINNRLDAKERQVNFYLQFLNWLGELKTAPKNSIQNDIIFSYRFESEDAVQISLYDPQGSELFQKSLAWHPIVSYQKDSAADLMPDPSEKYRITLNWDDCSSSDQVRDGGYESFSPGKSLDSGLSSEEEEVSFFSKSFQQNFQQSFQTIQDHALPTWHRHAFKLKQFINIVAISAGFLYIQECFNFWAQSNPVLMFAYTFAALWAVQAAREDYLQRAKDTMAVVGKHEDVKSLSAKTNALFKLCREHKLFPLAAFACFWFAPTLVPLQFLPVFFTLVSCALVFFAVKTIDFKNSYEEELHKLRQDSRGQFEQAKKHFGKENFKVPEKSPLQQVQSGLLKTGQFIWEFIRTAFPLLFFTDYFVTHIGGASIGVVQMNFATTLTHPPLGVLIPEVLITLVVCGTFAALMVADTMENERHEAFNKQMIHGATDPEVLQRAEETSSHTGPAALASAAFCSQGEIHLSPEKDLRPPTWGDFSMPPIQFGKGNG
jgi:hypothetical protein